MDKIGVISLGCSKNRIDTEIMLNLLKSSGFKFVNDPAEAEILIVNTCGFIDAAKEESIENILEMAGYKKSGKCKLLAVTGCLSQRYPEELKESLPEVDLFYGVRDYGQLARRLAELCGKPAPHASGCGRVLTTPPFRAYLRIADGCDNRCTYCAIPIIRGGRRSVPMDRLLTEAKLLADGGVKELTVIAQDTTSYGVDIYGRPMIRELLNELSKIDGFVWIRLMYAYPSTVTEELVDSIISNDKILNYIDIPIQHINQEVLRRMNRHGSKEHIEHMVKYIRKAEPSFILRTTAMVGFPGESEDQFRELLKFFCENPFNRVGAFAYSAEDGTIAAEYTGQVEEAVKNRRLKSLYSTQQKLSLEFNRRRIGKTERVLVEYIDNGLAYCRSYAESPELDGYIIVKDTDSVLREGDFADVILKNAEEYDIWGELTR